MEAATPTVIRSLAYSFLAVCAFTLIFSGCCKIAERRPPVFWYNEWDVEDAVFTTCGDPWEECKIDLEFECCEEEVSGDKGSTDPYQPLVEEYRISNGDSLDISVFGDEDTNINNLVVAPDGKIYYLFLDGIPAKERTIDEVQKDLQEKLRNMFIEPRVTVMPRFMSNQAVIILGRVNRPGLYPLYRSLTVRQGLGLAGGIVSQRELVNNVSNSSQVQVSSNYNIPVVDLKNSFIIRKGKKMDMNFENLINHPDQAEDIILKPGDYIYIASDERPGVFMLGNVLGPQVIPHRNDLTLLQAIGAVGGWTRGFPYSADVNDCLIIRGSLDCPKVAQVNLCDLIYGKTRDIPLESGDIVYVHNKNFRFGRQLIRIALNSFVSTFGGNAGSRFAQKTFNFGVSDD
jgi:protein involved in polysaccharide export with SLBB domain